MSSRYAGPQYIVDRTFVVASQWHPAIVRHELLHAAGYHGHPATINGVSVGRHVARWRD